MNLLTQFSLLILLSSSSPAAQHVLDLVRLLAEQPPTTALTQKGPGGCGLVQEGDVPRILPLRLTLETTDRGTYLIGDQMVFEVTIENVGQTPVTFPSRLAIGDLGRTPAESLAAGVTLHVENRMGKRFRLTGAALMGAADVAGSTIVIRPGERLRVRAPGSVRPLDEIKGLTSADGPTTLRAVLSLTTAPCRWAADVVSTNALTVTFRAR